MFFMCVYVCVCVCVCVCVSTPEAFNKLTSGMISMLYDWLTSSTDFVWKL